MTVLSAQLVVAVGLGIMTSDSELYNGYGRIFAWL